MFSRVLLICVTLFSFTYKDCVAESTSQIAKQVRALKKQVNKVKSTTDALNEEVDRVGEATDGIADSIEELTSPIVGRILGEWTGVWTVMNSPGSNEVTTTETEMTVSFTLSNGNEGTWQSFPARITGGIPGDVPNGTWSGTFLAIGNVLYLTVTSIPPEVSGGGPYYGGVAVTFNGNELTLANVNGGWPLTLQRTQ